MKKTLSQAGINALHAGADENPLIFRAIEEMRRVGLSGRIDVLAFPARAQEIIDALHATQKARALSQIKTRSNPPRSQGRG